MKKILSFILCIVLLTTAVPQGIFSYAAADPSSRIFVGMETDGTNNYYIFQVLPSYDEKSTDSSGNIHYYVWKDKTSYANCETHYDVWHSSTGSWKLGAAGTVVDDSRVDIYGGITKYLESLKMQLSFSVPMPDDVKKALDKGRLTNISVSPKHIHNNELIDEASIVVDFPSVGDSVVKFSAIPKFDFGVSSDDLYTYFDYDGPSDIFLLDESRGFNLWAVYKDGEKLGQASASFYYADPQLPKAGYADFTMLDEGGALKPGGKIRITDGFTERSYDTDGLRIGASQSVYEGGGAVGYSFRYIMQVQYDYQVLTEVFPTMETVTVPIGGGPATPPDPSDPGDPSAPADPDAPAPEDDLWAVMAQLDLPAVSYEGHEVLADDDSRIEKNGEPVNLTWAYAQGDAENTFSAPGASYSSRQGYLTDKLIYDKAGTYPVTLRVTAGDASDSDTKNIEIRATPSIQAILGGVQKENRKQTLDVTVAQSPLHPIESLHICIRDRQTGEAITAVRTGRDPSSSVQLSEHIKCRSLADTGSTDYMLSVQLAFLTKFSDTREFTYEITAEDSRGHKDSVSADFTVVPDLPPLAEILLSDVYYRQIGSNDAKITVSDGSTTDGDQLDRRWEISTSADGVFTEGSLVPGFGDDSFGTLHDIHFKKTGVGPFQVRLTVTDNWTEETLEEFILPEDHKSAVAEGVSQVGNIAPEILLSLKKQTPAELLLLAEGAGDYSKAKTFALRLDGELQKEGIAARIKTVRVDQSQSLTSGQIRSQCLALLSDRQLLGYSSAQYVGDVVASSFWGNGGGYQAFEDQVNQCDLYQNDANTCITTDGSCLYQMVATPAFDRTAYTKNYYTLAAPYRLNCYDLYENDAKPVLKWSSVITDKVFSSEDSFFSAAMVHDTEGSYLYLVSNGKTLLVEKTTGALLTVLDFEMGNFNTVCGGNIYSVKTDGIYRIPLSGGAIVRVVSAEIESGYEKAALCGGKIHFAALDTEGLKRGIFDPSGESVSYTRLAGSAADHVYNRGRCLAIDGSGRMLVYHPTGEFTVYDAGSAQGSTVKINIGSKYKVFLVTPVYDENGRICYGAAAAKYYDRDYTNYTLTLADPLKHKTAVYQQKQAEQVSGEHSAVCALYDSNTQTVCFEINSSRLGVKDWAYGPSVAALYHTDTMTAEKGDSVFSFYPYHFSARSSGILVTGALVNGTKTEHICCHAMITRQGQEVLDAARQSHLGTETDLSHAALYTEAATTEGLKTALLAGGKNADGVVLTAQKAGGSIETSLDLQAGKTYYYEYDTSAETDLFRVGSQVTAATDQTASLGYLVEEVVCEDFYDADIEEAFAMDGKASVVKGKWTLSASTDDSRYPAAASAGISFTIPQGKQALLSFSYQA
ncbi:MAG: PKD domain-containing protein, partial [Firmicutes bacterium]|nr:PKD domain-containing protein [Bacillota bacterium]